mgnify:CR=1 FL=1
MLNAHHHDRRAHVVVCDLVHVERNGGAPAGSAVIGLKLTGVPTGYHVVVLRWVVSGGTLVIAPVTQSINNNANLLIQEVSS